MKVACNLVGGPPECPFVAEGQSPDNLAHSLTDHVSLIHPGIKEQMDNMSEEDKAQWMAMMKAKITQ